MSLTPSSSSSTPIPNRSSQPPPYTQSHQIALHPESKKDKIIHSTPWFADGNLIIHSSSVHFKVYAGILAARSSVFNDMLAFPQPKENETVEGCVVVKLSGDDPGDVRWFLMALLDSSFFEPPPALTTLPILSAILRLSRKYNVPYLYHRALSHLRTTFPTTLDGWNGRDQTRTIPPVEHTPFAALQLAREMGLDWIVPSIVYCICSHPIGKTLSGAWWAPPAGEEGDEEREDEEDVEDEDDKDEEDEEGDMEEQEEDDNERTGVMIRLSERDRNMAISTRETLKEMQVEAVVTLISVEGENCQRLPRPFSVEDSATAIPQPFANGNTPNPVPTAAGNQLPVPAPGNPAPAPAPDLALPPVTCLQIRIIAAEIVASWKVAGLLDFHHVKSRSLLGMMCGPCREAYKREYECFAREMWDALPGLCDLGSWEVLEARRREAGL